MRWDTTLAAPHYGVREGHARVALDFPESVPFQLAPEGAHLSQLGDATVSGSLGLIALTPYPLDSKGSGFKVRTLTGSSGTNKPLELNFTLGVRSAAVWRLPVLFETQLAAVKQPSKVRRAIVIDMGHDGEDPRASSDYGIEKSAGAEPRAQT